MLVSQIGGLARVESTRDRQAICNPGFMTSAACKHCSRTLRQTENRRARHAHMHYTSNLYTQLSWDLLQIQTGDGNHWFSSMLARQQPMKTPATAAWTQLPAKWRRVLWFPNSKCWAHSGGSFKHANCFKLWGIPLQDKIWRDVSHLFLDGSHMKPVFILHVGIACVL